MATVRGDRAYGGVPAAERSDRRRAQLIAAALDCLATDGIAGVSVRSVCARARLTPRYFYESFGHLDELLVTAVGTVVDEVAVASVAAMTSTDGDTAARVAAAIDAGYGVVADDPGKATAILVASAGHGPLRARRQEIVSDYADLIIDSLPALNRLGLAERRRARATALFLMGGSADVIEAVLAGRLGMSRVRMVELLTTMWLGALRASLGERG